MFCGSEIYARSLMDSVSLSLEKEIGYINYRTILSRHEAARLTDTELQEVNGVFSRVAGQSNRRHEVEFTLTVLNDHSINAFALPGGFIFVTEGTLSFVKNKSELAGILGHEIAHIDRRHGIKALTRTAGMGLLFDMILAHSVSRRKELLQRAALISLNVIQLGYSRTAEFEADKYGLLLMEKAGYTPEKLLEFWHRIDNESENSVQFPGFFNLLATHPRVEERIHNIETSLKEQPLKR